MSGAPDPYADFASPAAAGDDPYAAIATPVSAKPAGPQPGEAAYKQRKGYGHRADRWLDAGIRGAADFASLGFADEGSAALDSLPALMPGGERYSDAFKRNVAMERGIDQADREDLPVTRDVGEAAGFLGTLAGSLIAAPVRAAAPAARGLAHVGMNVLRSAGAGAAFSGASAMGNATGDIGERAEKAIPAAVIGAGLGAAAVPVTAALGAGVNALTARSAPAVDRVARILGSRQDVNVLRARAADLRAAGADPTAISAVDESGRGFIRAAASRQTPGREIVQQRADASALNLPDRIGLQARNHLSADPRTPADIATDLGQQRATSANANFGAVRGDTLPIDSDMAAALDHPMGREAIAEAARRERDPVARQALLALPDTLAQPGAQLSVGMADRISRTLLGKAQAAQRTGDRDLGATYSQLADAVRGPARTASSGYDAALGDFAAQSRIMDAADRGEDFLKRNTDEFVANTPAPGEEGNDLARATARRAVERAAGENVSAAPGVARKLAYAPEQQARNAQLLGQEGADRFQTSMGAEARTNRDMQDVAPRTGSQTQLRTADQEATSNVVGAIQTVAGGPKAWAGAVINRLKTAGLSDRDAEAVATVSTDPRQLDDLLSRMEAKRPGSGQWLRTVINEATAPNAGEATQKRNALEVNVDRSTTPDYLAWRRSQGLPDQP